ncbi:Uncharacterised protein [Mycobacteroides abscessus subsp. massiliense]|nr:Uncharacterised protein [Mycobacteroides abscessus subsp. massiliense]
MRRRVTGRQCAERLFGGGAPQVVEHRVERPRGVPRGDGLGQVVAAERDRVIGADRPQPVQPLGIAASDGHMPGAEHRFRQLHGK